MTDRWNIPGATEDALPSDHPRDAIRRGQSQARAALNAIMVRIQKQYVGTERDRELREAVEDLIDGWTRQADARQAGPNFTVGRLAEAGVLLVLGHSGAGKTRLLERTFLSMPEFEGYGHQDKACPLITVMVPSPFTLREFAIEMLRAIGMSGAKVDTLSESAAWAQVKRLIEGRVAVIHVDEAQNLLESRNPVDIAKARNALRYLTQNKTWPVSIILSGLPQTKALLKDFQVGRRKEVVNVNPFDGAVEPDRTIFRRAFAGFCKTADLSTGFVLDDKGNLDRLFHASQGRIGVAIDLMHLAIRNALRAGDGTISIDHFALAFRRRTGCEPQENVFSVTKGYLAIAVEPLLSRDEHSQDGDEPEKKLKRPIYERGR